MISYFPVKKTSTNFTDVKLKFPHEMVDVKENSTEGYHILPQTKWGEGTDKIKTVVNAIQIDKDSKSEKRKLAVAA